MKVYLVTQQHMPAWYETETRVDIVGVFSGRELAEEAMKRAMTEVSSFLDILELELDEFIRAGGVK